MISAYPFGAGDHFSCIMEEIMNQSKKCNITIKWIISLLISTQTTLMCGSAGYQGAIITAMKGMIFYDVWINKRNHRLNSKQSS